jgi:hypothetical protein
MKSTLIVATATAALPVRISLQTLCFFSALVSVSVHADIDIERGKDLYENHCLVCHSDAIHKRKHSKVKSRESLYGWIQAWSTHAGLNWSNQEVDDTAAIVFVFRAVPGPGAGMTWFEIDVLFFDQQFLAFLALLTSTLTMVGMFILRPMMAEKSIAWVIVVLSIAFGILTLPNIGLYYGIYQWTESWSNGMIDARAIAIMDTMLESPLGQIAMIPMLAWIARSAPPHLKATFFAVMASFTNLALSAASLGTRYLNEWKTVSREVRDPVTDYVSVASDYSNLGHLLIAVTVVGVVVPILTVGVIQASPWKTKS